MTDDAAQQSAPQGYPPAAPYVPVAPVHPGDPGRAIGIVGFVLAFFFVLNIAGLVLSIIARVKSCRAGFRNGLALAGIIISAVGTAGVIVILAFAIPLLVNAGQECARLGAGVHVIGNSVYTCTTTSFNVTTH